MISIIIQCNSILLWVFKKLHFHLLFSLLCHCCVYTLQPPCWRNEREICMYVCIYFATDMSRMACCKLKSQFVVHILWLVYVTSAEVVMIVRHLFFAADTNTSLIINHVKFCSFAEFVVVYIHNVSKNPLSVCDKTTGFLSECGIARSRVG